MYRRRRGCPRGGAAGQHRGCGRTAASGLPLLGKGPAVLACAAVPLVLASEARAQGTLPPLSVEGTSPKAKKASTPKAAPAQPVEPAPQAETTAARDKARRRGAGRSRSQAPRPRAIELLPRGLCDRNVPHPPPLGSAS